jgi:hypothetical protein|tara:strand:+ start:4265 stop:4480 length:216 start_codon:yes stop_codon:yes gene_type:complete
MKTLDEIRAENRALMPEFTAVHDSLTEAFGQLKVVYAKENDREVGVEPDESEYVTVFIEPIPVGDSWGRIK